MQLYRAKDGSAHPCSDKILLYPKGWSQIEEDRVLMKWRSSGDCSEEDRSYLSAWTNRNNLESVLRLFGVHGGKHTDYFPMLDSVHFQLQTCDCGCEIVHVFDHWAPEKGSTPHKIHKRCMKHNEGAASSPAVLYKLAGRARV